VSAEHAELAGTLQSGTSHTPSTEDEDEQEVLRHGLVVLVKYTEDGLVIDSSLDVSDMLGLEWIGVLAAEKLTGKRNDKARKLASSLSMLRLRTRFDGHCYGPYLIKTEDPISVDELEQVLRAMPPDRRKAFLKGAAI
jgi:muconolactone delta-isomerase